MAAGLSLTQDQLEPAMARLGELLAAQGAGDRPPRSLRLDGLLAPGGATPELAAALAAAGPYGAGAPAPRLALAASRITGARRIGDGHLALRLADGLGGHLDAVAFRAFETPLGSFLEAQRRRRRPPRRTARARRLGRPRPRQAHRRGRCPRALIPRCTSGLNPGKPDDT